MNTPGQSVLNSALSHSSAALVVIHPSGTRTRVPLDPLPFTIGRHADNHLVLRDNRASRSHARLVAEGNDFLVEDLKSSHGIYVNGVKVERQKLYNGDKIEFGFPDSYSLIFTFEGDELQRMLDQFTAPKSGSTGTSNLAKLRALVDVARALQNSLSTDDVLTAVLDAALAITGFERGFLLLTDCEDLNVRVSRDRYGKKLYREDLGIPLEGIQHALRTRRELLSMTLDSAAADLVSATNCSTDEESRTVVCVPLVRVRTGSGEETCLITSKSDTVGLIYLDSRQTAIDLSSGNRELLQTLALEASTILENARLLEEERIKHRLEKEIDLAREIQMSLLPRRLPDSGWFCAAGSSIASHQVGGDCFDVRQIGPHLWSAVVSDVSGKGVSSALLAALLQGAFLLSADGNLRIEDLMSRMNQFLNERTEGEKYATVFYCTVDSSGLLRWTNAGHCTPFLVRRDGRLQILDTTGMPLGMLSPTSYEVKELQLEPGDKIVAYSDGLSEAQNPEGRFFDAGRMKDVIRAHANSSSDDLHSALMREVQAYTMGALQQDDITALVLEYRP